MSRDEYAAWADSILRHKTDKNSHGASLNNARSEPMDEDARQLILLAHKNKSIAAFISASLFMFFICGFCIGLFRYRKQL
jgi:hypothetical protein